MSDDLEGADIWGESAGNNNASNDAANDTSNNETLNANESEPTQEDDILDDETRNMSTSELRQRIMLLDNDIRVMKSEVQRISHESRAQKERIRENMEKVKMNKQLPYLVGNVIEVLEPEAEDGKKITCVLHCLVTSCIVQYDSQSIFQT